MKRSSFLLILVMGIASLASAGFMTMTATELSVGVYQIDLIQTAQDATGSGGVLKFNVGGYKVRDLTVVPVRAYDPGNGTMYGWEWLLAGIGMTDDGMAVQISATPGLGKGTPGVGSLMDPINQTLYTSTASFIISFQLDAPPKGYKWEYSGPNMGLFGEWDNQLVDQSVCLLTLPCLTPVLVPIPEPVTIFLFGMGGLLLRINQRK